MSVQELGTISVGILATNLIIHYRLMDISSKTAKFIHILNIVKETRNFALLCQWIEFSQNIL